MRRLHIRRKSELWALKSQRLQRHPASERGVTGYINVLDEDYVSRNGGSAPRSAMTLMHATRHPMARRVTSLPHPSDHFPSSAGWFAIRISRNIVEIYIFENIHLSRKIWNKNNNGMIWTFDVHSKLTTDGFYSRLPHGTKQATTVTRKEN